MFSLVLRDCIIKRIFFFNYRSFYMYNRVIKKCRIILSLDAIANKSRIFNIIDRNIPRKEVLLCTVSISRSTVVVF